MGSGLKRVFLRRLAPLLDKAGHLEDQTARAFSLESRVPSRAGCYVIYRSGRPVYVGETGNLRSRLLQSHRTGRSSAFWDKLRAEDPSQTTEDIEELIQGKCTFKFCEIPDGYRVRRRLQAFFQALYDPKLNFLAVREQNKKRRQLLTGIDNASQEGDTKTMKRLAEELRGMKGEVAE